MGAAVVVIALIIALVGGGSDGGTGTETPAAAAPASDVFLTPASTTGANPFTDSIAAPPPTSTVPQATVPPSQLAGSGYTSVDGATVGLYGGTRNVASCDAQKMVDYLAQNPDKARAWASAQGIDPSYIPTYVASLTPVLLRADTQVVNNGYENGAATPFATVLQAGTAVLIDAYGIPRVRCYCGNPLSPPVYYGTPRYRGPQWPAFDPTAVVIVRPAPTTITVITIVDVNTGQAFGRPVGTSGAKDTPAPTPPTTTAPAPTTTTTTPPSDTGSGPQGNFTLRFFGATFSGTPGLMTADACTLAGQDLSGIAVDIRTSGNTITITSVRFALSGTYNRDGTFTASADVPPVVGDSKVFTMQGTITDTFAVTGTYSIAVAPPSATCTFKMAGAKNA